MGQSRKETEMDNIDMMVRIEREIEKRMEAACEKDGWVVSVAMMPPENTTLFIEKFGETSLRSSDEDAALESAQAFAKAEFGTDVEVIRDEEKIPNTRAPYHIRLRLKVDASKRVQELAA